MTGRQSQKDATRIPAASAVITDQARRLVLVLRGTEPERGRWSVPGGHVEPGESFADAAAREALEETGLEVSIGRELPTVTIPAPDGRVFEIHHFAATVADGELVPGDDADDARWFNPAELRGIPLTADLLEYLMCSGIVPRSE